MDKDNLAKALESRFQGQFDQIILHDMVTMELPPQHLLGVCHALLAEEPFRFEQLVDLCGVDYLHFGKKNWRTNETTTSGFSRGTTPQPEKAREWDKPRYGVVYHLLSLTYNHRLRLRVFSDPEPWAPSVMDVWASANWYEREAFDLYGIVFEGHPDLRRLLTDYGFIGHPFRKDFPLIGEVELRYDAGLGRCVYEPVSINPRVLVPKVIRGDNRYV